MTALQHVATLDEKTVQRIATGDLPPNPYKPLRTFQKRFPVAYSYVHPDVMAAVKKIVDSGHGYTKIFIVDSRTVIVR